MRQIPSHRALALLRGRNEGFLRLSVVLPDESPTGAPSRAGAAHRRARGHRGPQASGRCVAPRNRPLGLEVQAARRTSSSRSSSGCAKPAEAEAIRVFGSNLRDLLLAAPAGQRVTMGLDPGIRTGVKVAVVDGTGRLLETATIYPHEPRNDWEGALRTLAALVREARRAADRHRQRHGVARDRQARRRPDGAPPEAAADQDRRVGGGCVGLFGIRAGRAGVPERRRLAARRGLDRAPAAGSARRAGADRAEGDRRRPVPARRQPGAAGAARSTRSSRTASTPSAPTSTRRRRRCSRASPG